MTNTALIVVDIQNDYFSGGKWELNATDAAADNAARVIGAARERGDLVIHIRHETLAPNAPFFVPGSDGAQLHENVRNLGDELVIVKHFMNPYRETQLLEVLEHNEIERVTVVGNMSHMCIDAVTRASDDFGFETTVIHDACTTHDLEFNNVKVPALLVHAAFMAALKFGYAEVLSTDEYVA
ncbi:MULTISPECIES: cysteine hydrolase family protein [Pseudomonas]|jgi:nicotinamidase-related amidase|uniref:Nicotinamidase-related amidase n=1 Tax=Pseudomonas moorei TaxID=395599 RepID=A0A1H1F2Y3_9PSED|nr:MULTISPECIES: cysteine hydrolase family protein [Pseudomonas]KAB0509901.1 cysteine hydrolase [Pseudomonas moorei]NBB63379.1 isochorismatase family protein [Pseudomonas sp. ODNR1LW]SDQ95342.1 Nicotinamidase-related amidase [Pseudomonas moorei]